MSAVSRRLAAVAPVVLIAVLAVAAPAEASPAFDPYSVPIPAMCKHPASRLHHGTVDFGVDKSGASLGGASLVDLAKDSNPKITHPLYARQRTPVRSGAAAAVPIWCSAGGVGWPDTIALYTRGGKLLASKYLGGLARHEHAGVTAISLHGDTIHAKWDAYEGAGFDIAHQSADFTLAKGKLVVSRFRKG